MTISREQAELELISRCGGKMSLVGFSTDVDGTNSSLDSPFRMALVRMGFSVSGMVSDEDLSSLTPAQVEEFFDRAELRLLENIEGNFALSNIKVGARSDDFADVIQGLQKRIDFLRKSLEKKYGDGLASLEGGVIAMNFTQKIED